MAAHVWGGQTLKINSRVILYIQKDYLKKKFRKELLNFNNKMMLEKAIGESQKICNFSMKLREMENNWSIKML